MTLDILLTDKQTHCFFQSFVIALMPRLHVLLFYDLQVLEMLSPKKVASRTSLKGKVIIVFIYLFLVTAEPFAGSNVQQIFASSNSKPNNFNNN